jgi:hypothetical protein
MSASNSDSSLIKQIIDVLNALASVLGVVAKALAGQPRLFTVVLVLAMVLGYSHFHESSLPKEFVPAVTGALILALFFIFWIEYKRDERKHEKAAEQEIVDSTLKQVQALKKREKLQ